MNMDGDGGGLMRWKGDGNVVFFGDRAPVFTGTDGTVRIEKIVEFPKHNSMYITHNQHKDYYMTVAEYFSRYPHTEDVTEDIKQRCIAQNEIWEIQWYPNTPISFYYVIAPTFDEALKIANEENPRCHQ